MAGLMSAPDLQDAPSLSTASL